MKAGASGIIARHEPFEPGALIQQIADALRARLAARNVAVAVEIASDTPPGLIGDAVRLHGILEALADNAAKFTETGEIRLKLYSEARPRGPVWLVVEVADTGIGLTPEAVRQIFRPFNHGGPGEQRFSGTGLGLAHARAVARALGGDLTAWGTPGKGSVFRLVVPCQPGIEPAMAAKIVTRALAILLVEDNVAIAQVTQVMLQALGHRVMLADTASAGIAAAKNGGLDLVLMDLTLPDSDGLSATRAIRALPGAAGHVKILALSAHNDVAAQTAALQASINGYVTKPVSTRALAEAIREVM
jgi:CheY-like chemotaxis protein